MARTTVKVKYSSFDGLQNKISALLSSKGYKNINENNEDVWKNGMGFLTAMKYIKIEFAENNTLVISGWCRAMAGGEMDLNGVVGALPKKQVMNVIKELQAIVK